MATSYGKVAIGAGGFTIPDVEDGEYPATVKSVKDGQGQWEGTDYDQYIIEYELDGLVDEGGVPVTLAQFVRIPEALQTEGLLNPDSNLYMVVEALGYDMEEPIIEPDEWPGKKVRIYVENKKIQSGKNAGQIRPRITKVKAPARRTAAAAAVTQAKPSPAPAAKEPVAAASGRRVRQADPNDDF